MIPTLSIIVPTYNESGNVRPLFERLSSALRGLDWDVVFVDDDSTDGTRDEVRQLEDTDRRVRLIHRVGRRGLSSACIEGMLSTMSPVVAVMDADLQHDETILPQMYETLTSGGYDLVIGSRYTKGGDATGLAGFRMSMSLYATRITHLLTRVPVADPMSGFFMIRRTALDETVRKLSGRGFKILLDLLISAPRPLRCTEVSYSFRNRHSGVSKLDTAVLWEFALVLLSKFLGNWIPVRFLMFLIVGGLGVAVHLAVLGISLFGLQASFSTSQAAAVAAAMTSNFFLNNLFTYRDLRLRGWQLIYGLVMFYVGCSLGAIVNLATAEYLFEQGLPWWVAGVFGAIASAVWNFGVVSVFAWHSTARSPD
jgi:dolichol-phosphate mannosyltransferase